MRKREVPDASSLPEGPDGAARRTRRTALSGGESYERERPLGRNQAMIDEESAWLNAMFIEPEEER